MYSVSPALTPQWDHSSQVTPLINPHLCLSSVSLALNPQLDQNSQGTSWSKPHLYLYWVCPALNPSETRAPRGPPDPSLTSVCLQSVQLRPSVRPELPGELLFQASSLSVFGRFSFAPPSENSNHLGAAGSFYLKQAIQECWLFNFSLEILKNTNFNLSQITF